MNRTFKVIAAVAIVAAIALALMPRPEAQQSTDVLRVKQVVVEDAEGRGRIVLGYLDAGSTRRFGMRINDPAGDERLGEVGEARRHLGLRREVLLGGEQARPARIGEDVSFGDADARFVRTKRFALQELDRMRCHDRKADVSCDAYRGCDECVVVGHVGRNF